MNIKYITNVRLPTPRAQGYAIMKMCEEFAKAGVRVELFIPERKNLQHGGDPFNFYKITRNFDIRKVASFDLLGITQKFGKIFYWIDVISFFINARLKILLEKKDLIYSRDYLTAIFFPKDRVVLEIHDIPSSFTFFKIAIKRAKLIFVLNNNLKQALVEMGMMADKIFISPSGVELKDFDNSMNKQVARQKLKLDTNKQIVMYTGHLYKWKGVDDLALAAIEMPETLFVFVGGVVPEIDQFISKYKKYTNIVVRPFVERAIMPAYLAAADVLVLPNSAMEVISSRYTSPLKLFEYMASKRPIVASSLPSIREILDEQNCIFFTADDHHSLVIAIKNILKDKILADSLSGKAFEEVKKYTWEKRAANIFKQIFAHNYFS